MTNILRNNLNETTFDSLKSEIAYWNEYLEALKDLNKQFQKPEVKLSMKYLKKKQKNIKVSENLSEFLNIPENIEKVTKIVQVMNKIPVN